MVQCVLMVYCLFDAGPSSSLLLLCLFVFLFSFFFLFVSFFFILLPLSSYLILFLIRLLYFLFLFLLFVVFSIPSCLFRKCNFSHTVVHILVHVTMYLDPGNRENPLNGERIASPKSSQLSGSYCTFESNRLSTSVYRFLLGIKILFVLIKQIACTDT